MVNILGKRDIVDVVLLKGPASRSVCAVSTKRDYEDLFTNDASIWSWRWVKERIYCSRIN
jgi:hypothetical protein